MAETVLETERLILRRFRDDDLAAWCAHLNTLEVRAHLGGVVSAKEMAERFARQRDSWDDDKGGWLAIERKADGAFLGYCGFGRFGGSEVCSQTSEANRGSWRVMERLGMERAEALDYEDPAYPPEENPTKVYRLTREAWGAQRG